MVISSTDVPFVDVHAIYHLWQWGLRMPAAAEGNKTHTGGMKPAPKIAAFPLAGISHTYDCRLSLSGRN